MGGRSRHVWWMHVSIRLHLVHAVVARWGEAEAVLIAVRRALMRLCMQRLAVAIQGRHALLRGRCLEACRLAVHRCSVGRVGTRATVAN
jgi:hypothetical protein